MKILRNTLAGLALALAATVISATSAAADPNPDAQPADFAVVVDLSVDTPVITDDFGWG